MLPYVIIFELTDSWINKFKDIKIKDVEWYEDYNGENNIKNFIYKVYPKIEKTIIK